MRLFSLSPAGRDPPSPGFDKPPVDTAPPDQRIKRRLGVLVVGGILVAVLGVAAWTRFRSSREKWSPATTGYQPFGMTAQKDNHLDEARDALAAAIRLRPDDAIAHLHYADLLLMSGDPTAAVPHYEIAVRGLPKAIPPRLNLAVALGAIGRMREATECAESVLQIDPNNAEAKAILASLPHTDGTPPSR